MTSSEFFRPIQKCKRCCKPESMTSKLIHQDYKAFNFLHGKGYYCPLCAERNLKECINFNILFNKLTGKKLKEELPSLLKDPKHVKK